nr:hypothetical protein [Comamonas testosteroni]
MRKWLTMAAAAATLALSACSGTMPTTSSSAGGSGSVEVFGTVDTGVTRTW